MLKGDKKGLNCGRAIVEAIDQLRGGGGELLGSSGGVRGHGGNIPRGKHRLDHKSRFVVPTVQH
jgi:hypothetical protein